MSAREIKLNPCPFCGGLSVVQEHNVTVSLDGANYHDMKITCVNCGVTFSKSWRNNNEPQNILNEHLIDTFNRRL
jgi:transcription elongation factor Elf1